jgi:hypothetical protein
MCTTCPGENHGVLFPKNFRKILLEFVKTIAANLSELRYAIRFF